MMVEYAHFSPNQVFPNYSSKVAMPVFIVLVMDELMFSHLTNIVFSQSGFEIFFFFNISCIYWLFGFLCEFSICSSLMGVVFFFNLFVGVLLYILLLNL